MEQVGRFRVGLGRGSRGEEGRGHTLVRHRSTGNAEQPGGATATALQPADHVPTACLF